jgi:small-conductance mechanosensitive channel
LKRAVILGSLIARTSSFLLVVAVLLSGVLASSFLTLPLSLEKYLLVLLKFTCMIQVAFWLDALLSFFLKFFLKRKILGKSTSLLPFENSNYSLLITLSRVTLWIVISIFALDNLGLKVTSLVAGLGIGGLVVAVAVRKILEDILSSVSILLDKPFETGDVILVGDVRGTVEKIGIKSTRIRSTSGEEVSISNTSMIRTQIHNFKNMNYRRALFTIKLDISTPPDTVRKISRIIQEIIQNIEHTRFDRTHFSTIRNSFLEIETVYFVNSREYVMLMDIQQKINISILEYVSCMGISFAYMSKRIINKK